MSQLDMLPEVQEHPEDEPNERYTPRAVFAPLDREFRFTLDACATPESAKVERYFTKAQDGLKKSWALERVWCNPPYDDIGTWVAKAWAERLALTVMLVPAWTDREWWAEHVEPFRDGRDHQFGRKLSTRFLRGRIRFGMPGNPEGFNAGSPPFWCCLLIWGSTSLSLQGRSP